MYQTPYKKPTQRVPRSNLRGQFRLHDTSLNDRNFRLELGRGDWSHRLAAKFRSIQQFEGIHPPFGQEPNALQNLPGYDLAQNWNDILKLPTFKI